MSYRVYPLLAALTLSLAVSVSHAQTSEPGASLHCPTATALEARYQKKFAEPMSRWSQKELADAKGRPVLYLFSGPDIVTALALFPDAPHVVLVADQIPEYAQLSRADEPAAGAVARECHMLSFFAQLGYYRTHDLNGQGGAKPRFIELLRYSIAFGGATVNSTQALALGPTGEAAPLPAGTAGKPQGVRFEARRADGRAVTIDYLAIDLSNHGLKADPAGAAFLKRSAGDVLFLKSASHLLQSRSFSTLADLLTTPAPPFVVQDETGLSVDRLEQNYALTLWGQYRAPQSLWAHNAAAKAFVDEYAAHPSRGALPFVLGYEKSAGSALLIGRRR